MNNGKNTKDENICYCNFNSIFPHTRNTNGKLL